MKSLKTELPTTTLLETIAVCDAQKTPPPEPLTNALVNVNPDRLAPVVKYTQRFEWPPSIIVNCGPLTLRRFSGLSTITLLPSRTTTEA